MYFLEEDVELAKNAKIKFKYLKLGIQIKSILSPKQYIVFRLRIIENEPYPVIADIMGLTESTIRGHYHKALKKIRNI